MPRLSVIIPHRRDDQLEATLLSVLENRPADCEVLVVHDGSYSNPYQLDDEVVFVDVEAGADVVQMLNAGVMAACSPIVSTVLDGVTVQAHWCDQALMSLESQPELAMVAVAISRDGQPSSCGIDAASIQNPAQLRSGQFTVAEAVGTCAAPELACGVFRRSVLLALNGFRTGEIHAAEIDLGYVLQELQLSCLCVDGNRVYDQNLFRVSSRDLAQIATLGVQAGVLSSGWLAGLQELPKACWKHRGGGWGWFLGIATTPDGPRSANYASEEGVG